MEQKFVLIPRSGIPRNFLLVMGFALLTALFVVGTLLAAAYTGAMRRGLEFSIPDDFFTTVLIMTLFTILLIFFVMFVTANHELIWANNPRSSEIRLEDQYYGRPVFVRRYPKKDVAGIRVWWQRTHSGSGKPVTGNPGWWMAALVFWNGKSIHLHAERGGPENVPFEWLERLERACQASGLELKREPVPFPAAPPPTSIVNRLKRGQ